MMTCPNVFQHTHTRMRDMIHLLIYMFEVACLQCPQTADDAHHEQIMYLYICVNIRINADTYRCISVYRGMYL